jgi:[acyl-carrier-protein] S-malonyltransferase
MTNNTVKSKNNTRNKNNKGNDCGKNIAFMFPGQGSQYINMGMDFLNGNKKYFDYLDISSNFLGKNLKKTINNENDMGILLDDTRFAQITIFSISCALNDFLLNDCKINSVKIKTVIGHSLGDYSALYCCNAFNYSRGAEFVTFRGNLMGSYTQAGSNIQANTMDSKNKKMTMAAVLGSDFKTISDVLEDYRGRVFIANYNDYSQIVISGYSDDVLQASENIKVRGAKRVIPLKVSIASHCPLMKDASIRLNDYITENFNNTNGFNNLRFNFFSSTEVKEIGKNEIKKVLVNQLFTPVNWVESIERLLSNNINIFIEIGPGKVLAGLIKRIVSAKVITQSEQGISIFNTDTLDDIESLLTFLESENLIL